MPTPDEVLTAAMPVKHPAAEALEPLERFCFSLRCFNHYLRHHLIAAQQLHREEASFGSQQVAFVRLLAGWLRLLDQRGDLHLVGDGEVDAAVLYPALLCAHDWWQRRGYPDDYLEISQHVAMRALGVGDERSTEINRLLDQIEGGTT